MLLWITQSIYAIFPLITPKYFIEFFLLDVMDFNQVPPTPLPPPPPHLIYHDGELQKMCRPTYP